MRIAIARPLLPGKHWTTVPAYRPFAISWTSSRDARGPWARCGYRRLLKPYDKSSSPDVFKGADES